MSALKVRFLLTPYKDPAKRKKLSSVPPPDGPRINSEYALVVKGA